MTMRRVNVRYSADPRVRSRELGGSRMRFSRDLGQMAAHRNRDVTAGSMLA
jgi:hypothetical protein